MDASVKAIEELIRKAGDTEVGSEAVCFSQAALNAANALCSLNQAKVGDLDRLGHEALDELGGS